MLFRSLLLAVFLLTLPACGGGDNSGSVPSELTGVILFVETDEREEVTGFTLRTEDETYELSIAQDVDYGFDLRHLNDHARTGDPVRCRIEARDGDLYALTIEDAPVSSGTGTTTPGS